MRKLFVILLLAISLAGYCQKEQDLSKYNPSVAWRTKVNNVTAQGIDTFVVEVNPLDWNEPGAVTRTIGNYLIDYGGFVFNVIDSSETTVTVVNLYKTGVGPQIGRTGIIYRSVGEGRSIALAPIYYSYLSPYARENIRRFELSILWDILSDTLVHDTSLIGLGISEDPLSVNPLLIDEIRDNILINTDSIIANELRIEQNEDDIASALAYTWDDVMQNGNTTTKNMFMSSDITSQFSGDNDILRFRPTTDNSKAALYGVNAANSSVNWSIYNDGRADFRNEVYVNKLYSEKGIDAPITFFDVDTILPNTRAVQFYTAHSSSPNLPTSAYYKMIHFGYGSPGDAFNSQLAIPMTASDMYFRKSGGTNWSSWRKILDSENFNITNGSISDIILGGGEGVVNQTNSGTVRLIEGISAGYQGSYMTYNGAINTFCLGTHASTSTSASDDIPFLKVMRGNTHAGFQGTVSGDDAYQEGQFVTYGQDTYFNSLELPLSNGYIPFSNAGILDNSPLFTDGTDIRLGYQTDIGGPLQIHKLGTDIQGVTIRNYEYYNETTLSGLVDHYEFAITQLRPSSNTGFYIGNYSTTLPIIQSAENDGSLARNLAINPFGGNLLLGTTTDNSTDKLQVNGTASGSDAYQDGQFVTYGQDAYLNSLELPLTDSYVPYSNGGILDDSPIYIDGSTVKTEWGIEASSDVVVKEKISANNSRKFSLDYGSQGVSGAFGSKRLTSTGAGDYSTYISYDSYWNSDSLKWFPYRSSLGRKFMMKLGYHINGFSFNVRNDISDSWLDSEWKELMGVRQGLINVNEDFKIENSAPILYLTETGAVNSWAFIADANDLFIRENNTADTRIRIHQGGNIEFYNNATFNDNINFLASKGIIANDYADLNSVGENTIKLISPISTSFQRINAPTSSNYWSGFEFRHNIVQDYRSQLLMATSSALRLAMRNYLDGTWTDWVEFWHSGNLNLEDASIDADFLSLAIDGTDIENKFVNLSTDQTIFGNKEFRDRVDIENTYLNLGNSAYIRFFSLLSDPGGQTSSAGNLWMRLSDKHLIFSNATEDFDLTAGGGVTDHSLLTNLDYANSGHTGFAGTGVSNTFSGTQTFSSTVVFDGSIQGEPLWYGDFQFANGGSYLGFVGGTSPGAGTSSVGRLWMNLSDKKLYFTNNTTTYDLTAAGGGTTDHPALTNLDYANSGHTGFAGTGVSNTFSGTQTFSSSVIFNGNLYGAPIWNGNLQLGNGGAYLGLMAGTSPGAGTSSAGRIWMNTYDKKLYFTNNTTTYDLTAAGGGTGDGYISSVSLSGTYLNFTGVLNGFNGSVDLSSLGGGSMVYPGAGIPVSTGSAWGTSIANNSNNWNDAYNNKIVSAAVSGTATKTITLNQQDGGTVTATFTDLQGTGGGGDVFKDGTPVNKQLGIWVGDGVIKGDPDLEWEDTYLSVGNGLIRMYATNGNIISEAVSTDAIYLSEKSVKPTAAPGTGVFYPKTDGKPYFVNDSGVEYDLSATGGGVTDGDKGDVTVSGDNWTINSGVVGSLELSSTGVTPATYINPNITIGADGRINFAQGIVGQSGFSGAKVYSTSTQTATSSGTILSFGGEEYDINGLHSTTNSSRITMPTVYGSASIVEVKFSAQFKALGDITGDVELLKNGSVIKTWDLAQTGLTGQLTINVAENFVVAANDYLEIRVTTSSNSTSATTTALRPSFSVNLITIVT